MQKRITFFVKLRRMPGVMGAAALFADCGERHRLLDNERADRPQSGMAMLSSDRKVSMRAERSAGKGTLFRIEKAPS